MLYDFLVSAAASSVVVGAVVLLGKIFLTPVIEKWISHQFDRRLESTKSLLRQEEEKLKSELAAHERRLEALGAAALSALQSRNQVLDKRRIEALERLWNGVIELRPLRSAAMFTQSLKMDVVIERAARSDSEAEKMREFADMLWRTSGLEKFNLPDAPDRERPFVSSIVWGLFSAYRQFLFLPMAQLSVARSGQNKDVLANPKAILDLAKTTLPDRVSYIDQHGLAAIPNLLEEVESKLLAAISSGLEYPEADEKALQRAHEIQKAAEKVAIPPAPTAPDAGLVTKTPPP